jgi:glutaminase
MSEPATPAASGAEPEHTFLERILDGIDDSGSRVWTSGRESKREPSRRSSRPERFPTRSSCSIRRGGLRALPDEHGRSDTSRVYPALGRVPGELFGICVAGINGGVFAVGDSDTELTIMSVAKPFVYALVCQELGREEVRQRVGVNATGLPFNSLAAVEQSVDGRTNPMVNPGAIAVTSLVPGPDAEERWRFIQEGSNHRNQSLARLLQSYGRLYADPAVAVDLYTKQSCLSVTARDLAVMGSTLANGGVNPLTHERVVDAEACHCTLAVMTTAGLYETSGDWLYDISLPGKSGIGGGMVTVAPGKGGLGTFARCSTRPGTASRASSRSSHDGSAWTCSRRYPRTSASRAASGRRSSRASPISRARVWC